MKLDKAITHRSQINKLYLILCLFMVVFWVFNDFGIRYIYGYGLLGLLLVFQLFTHPVRIKITKIKIAYLWLIAVTTLFSLLPYSNKSDLTIALTISMLMFSLYVLFVKTDSRQIFGCFNIIKRVATIFSIYLILTKLFPFIYWDYVFPHLSLVSQIEAKLLISQGYGVPIGASSTYADYVIVVAILITIAHFFLGNFKERRILILVNLLLYFAAMLVENRRSEVIMIIITCMLMFVFLLDPRKRKDFNKKVFLIFKILTIITIIICICYHLGLLTRFVNTVTQIMSNSSNSNDLSSGRLSLWEKAWLLFKNNPVIGIGWEQFMNNNKYNHEVHNTYLQFLCETGVLGTFMLIIPIMSLFIYGLKLFRKFVKSMGIKYPMELKLFTFVGLGIQLFFLLLNIIDPAYFHQNYFCFFSFSVILLDFAYFPRFDLR